MIGARRRRAGWYCTPVAKIKHLERMSVWLLCRWIVGAVDSTHGFGMAMGIAGGRQAMRPDIAENYLPGMCWRLCCGAVTAGGRARCWWQWPKHLVLAPLDVVGRKEAVGYYSNVKKTQMYGLYFKREPPAAMSGSSSARAHTRTGRHASLRFRVPFAALSPPALYSLFVAVSI